MSRYAVDKVLWQIARDESACAAFLRDRAVFLDGRDLSEVERELLVTMDYASLFKDGAHPFLLYTCRIRLSGSWTFGLMIEHIDALAGIDPPLDSAT